MMASGSDSIVSLAPAARRRSRAWWLALPISVVLMSACGTAKADSQPADPLRDGLKAQVEGRTAEAIKDYHAVLDKDPHNKYAYYNLGLIDQLAGRAGSAELNYRTALASDPNFAPALYNLAILRTAPAPEEAVMLYRHVIALKSGDAAAHLNLGFLLISLKQVTEGKTELNRAVVLDPSLEPRVKATMTPPTSSAAPAKK
jgi:tetratricopeptide (TPR) repeat protein